MYFEQALSQHFKDVTYPWTAVVSTQNMRAGTHHSCAPQSAPSTGRKKKEENPDENWKC